jgi:hypothetical protein
LLEVVTIALFLFGSEGLDGIESGGAPRRKNAGESCNCEEQGSDGCEDKRIERFGLVEHGANEANRGRTSGETTKKAK